MILGTIISDLKMLDQGFYELYNLKKVDLKLFD